MPSFYDAFKDTQVNNFALSVGIVHYIMMAFEFYDKEICETILKQPLGEIENHKFKGVSKYDNFYQELKSISQNRSPLADLPVLEDDPENNQLPNEMSDSFSKDEDKIVEGIVKILASASDSDELSGMNFLFSPSLKELEHDKAEKGKLWVCLKRLFTI